MSVSTVDFNNRHKPTAEKLDSARLVNGCWEILLHLTARYPVHSLSDLMRMTRLAEHAHGKGLRCDRPISLD